MWSDPWIACTGNGRITHMLNKGNTKAIAKNHIKFVKAVASQNLWIWHAFFGMPGSHNDINVLQWSPLFARLTEGNAPPCNYIVNGHEYNMGYYLVGDINPSWATFVKTISGPLCEKKFHFAKKQEAAWKDVEFCKHVLQLFVDLLNNGIERPCGR